MMFSINHATIWMYGKAMFRCKYIVYINVLSILVLLIPTSAVVSDTDVTKNKKIEFLETQSIYITMPDDVRIAADIFLPQNSSDKSNLPTIISFTRYWRSASYEPDMLYKNLFVSALNAKGFAFVMVDTRGSGASFGIRETEFSTCETRDFKVVIDWVATRPWSNGRVATIGISYAGNTSENAIIEPPSVLKAAVPRFTDFDLYSSILFPGGLANQVIFSTWGDIVRDLDNNVIPNEPEVGTNKHPKLLGPRPVDKDIGRHLLNKAVAGHAVNEGVRELFGNINFRDEMFIAADLNASCKHAVSPYKFQNQDVSQKIPAFHWASWMDAGTAAGVLSRFASNKTSNRYIIGPWSHGAKFDANPLNEKEHELDMSYEKQYSKIIEFLEPLIVHIDHMQSPIQPYLEYYTMGENKWKKTNIWPPAKSHYVEWFLSNNQILSEITCDKNLGKDDYKVNYTAGTGEETRWTTQLDGSDVFYGNRADDDKKLLVYTSAPLQNAIEITGTATVELFMSSTHEDGAVIAYLEAVNPVGEVIMITEGGLRLIHRKLKNEQAEFKTFGPYHSFNKDDALMMEPGKVERVAFTLLPTSIVIPKGYSIRLAIAGHDKDTFQRYPEKGSPTYSFYRGGLRDSKLILPIINSN